MNSKKKTLIISTIIILLLLLAVGGAYAFFSYENGTKSDIVTGQIYMNYEETSTISLTGVFPETKEQALARQDENGVFEFTITGRNTSKYPIYYEIDLLDGGVITGKTETSTKILPEHVMIYLEKDGLPVIEGQTYKDFNNQRIYVETVPANQETNIEHKYTLRMWIDESVTISDTDPNADYTTSEWNDSYASLKVRVVGDFEEKVMTTSLVNKIENTLTLTDDDIYGTRYVTGDNNTDNYVWYSGKLWRIVSVNDDETIKLVTQNNVTSLAWDVDSYTLFDYNNSLIRLWLNDEFLPTLYNNDKLLVSSTWDYAPPCDDDPSEKCYTDFYIENEKVGLLSLYDTCKSGICEMLGTSSSFLKNGYRWWIINNGCYFVLEFGGLDIAAGSEGGDNFGVRPSINLKSNVQVIKGNGTKLNPYILLGDKNTGVTSELLNQRISGEYVKFNDVLYRIVGTEEINGQTLTKITMADYSLNKNTLTTSLAFGADSSEKVFSTAYGIGRYLEEWYQAYSTSETYATTYIKDNYKAMIATSDNDGIVWYTGPTQYNDYALSKTGTPISATIGLPYYGEMFSSQFGNGIDSSTDTWLMTIYDAYSPSWVLYSEGPVLPASGFSDKEYGVRPSFYLKSNVKIESGSGMPHDPYTLTQ